MSIFQYVFKTMALSKRIISVECLGLKINSVRKILFKRD